MNKAVAAFRQDHGRGIMIHVTSQRAEDGLRVVIRKTSRTSVSGGRPAARLHVVSPFPEEKQGWFRGCEVKCGTAR